MAGSLSAAEVRRFLVFAGVATVGILVALGPIADGDIYWHLAAGRWMWRAHGLVRTDPFTISAGGRPWTDVHWLFQLAVFAVHHVAGFAGLTIVKAGLVATAAVVLTRTAERSGGPAARLLCAVILGAGLFAARHLLPLRPVIVTVFFVALSLDRLEAWRTGSSRGRLTLIVSLPAIQIIWVNCQGLAPIGPALIAAYLAGELWARRRGTQRENPPIAPLALTLGLVVMASFATPYGLAAVTLPVRLLSRLAPGAKNVFSTSVAENIPPFVLMRTAPEQIAHFVGALVAAGILLTALRPRLPFAHLIVLGAFLVLALTATRNVLLLYVVAPPLLAIALGSSKVRGLAARAAPWLPRMAAVLIIGEVTLAGLALAREPAVARPTPFRFPVESSRRLASLDVAGPVFAPDHHGGYLTFNVPALRPYIDTRLVLHTADEYASFLAMLDDPARFDALDAEQRFQYVVLTTSSPDRYLRLAVHLINDPTWSLVYTDGAELLFTRAALERPAPVNLADPKTVDTIVADLRSRYANDASVRSAALLNLGRLLIVAGVPQQAERALAGSDSRAAASLRVRARFAAGDLAAAEALARVLLAQDAADAAQLALLGELALARGKPAESRAWVRQALAGDPYCPEAQSLLDRLEAAKDTVN